MTREYLYVQEAAQLAGCSTKTLYRRMRDGSLPYEVGDNGRRMIERTRLMQLLSRDKVSRPVPSHQNLQYLTREVEALRVQIARQQDLLLELVELYRPDSPKALRQKQGTLSAHRDDGSARTS